jgi:hypothetical protein
LPFTAIFISLCCFLKKSWVGGAFGIPTSKKCWDLPVLKRNSLEIITKNTKKKDRKSDYSMGTVQQMTGQQTTGQQMTGK